MRRLRGFLRAAVPAALPALAAPSLFPSGPPAAAILAVFLLFAGPLFLLNLLLESWFPRWRQPLLTRHGMLLGAGLLLLAAIGKTVWFEHARLSGAALLAGAERQPLLEERAYLLRAVARADFGPQDIPALFPSPFREELAIATLSMTTLALTNLAFLYPETQLESREAVRRMIEAMLTPAIRRYEVLWWGEDALDNLEGTKGHIGYLGHLNLMLACFKFLGGDSRHDELFERVSAALGRRLASSPGFHAPTFPGLTFTADNSIVVATLALHDRLAQPQYATLVADWTRYTREHLLDPASGLVRYHVDPNGRPLGTDRGVLQAWNSLWLPFIDPPFAADQYQRMKARLADGIPVLRFGGIREYPRGIYGPTDLIAGPIIFGISSAATGFAIAGARWHQDAAFLDELLRSAEFFGFSWVSAGERRYLTAPLVGQAIVLAAKTMVDFDRRFSGAPV